MSEIKEGSRVQWLCKPYGRQSFWCTGMVLETKTMTFGARKIKLGAKILVETERYHEVQHKDTTWVSVDKLKII